ncbi:MAG: response regulator transcription factor [Dehalococcoidales bacterium]
MVTGSTLVLVVDDELHLCNALRRILEKEGYKVITATNGKTALRLIEEQKPDVILLDLMMPGINGKEVCRRAREFSTATQIIYFTAKMEPLDPSKLRELRSEADAFIAKPATSKQILSKISRVLRRPRRQP